MKILLYALLLCTLACNTTPGKTVVSTTVKDSLRVVPKDTLLACVEEAAGIINMEGVGLKELRRVFESRQQRFKIAIDYLPVPVNNNVAGSDVLHVYIDTVAMVKKTDACFVEIVNYPLSVVRQYDYITLNDVEKKFGAGKMVPWRSTLGLDPPKEYIPPIRYEIPHHKEILDPVHLLIITDRPLDKTYPGIQYMRLCY